MSIGRYRRLLGRRPAREVDADLRIHTEMLVEDLVARGMTAEEAHRVAATRMGDIGSARSEGIEINRRIQRQETLAILWQSLVQDIRYAARAFSQEKAWTALAILTLALGIGANSAIFSIVNAVLLRALPFHQPDQIMVIGAVSDGTESDRIRRPIFEAWDARSKQFSVLAGFRSASTVLRGTGDAEIVNGRRVTRDYFDVFGVEPMLGRHLGAAGSDVGERVVLISEQVWRRVYGADSSIVGRTILLDHSPARLIGVMPASFTTSRGSQFWEPLVGQASLGSVTSYIGVLGKLADGATPTSARAELQALMPPADAEGTVTQPIVNGLRERVTANTRPALMMLFAAVAVVLLIACANVANLLLARATRRQREIAVRTAIGASSWRITRLIMAESLMLGLTGAAVGLGLARILLDVFVKISPAAISGAEGIAIDSAVLVFCAVTGVATALLFGLAPALQVRRLDVNVLLTSAGSYNVGRHRAWLRRGIVVAQLATALMLVTGAGLLTRSFATVMSLDTGFDPAHVVVADMSLSPSRYDDEGAVRTYFDQLMTGVAAIPGVEAVALTNVAPLGGAATTIELTGLQGRPEIDFNSVTPDFFRATGIQLVGGRAFNAEDRSGSERVAIVNESAARLFGGTAGVIGKQLPFGDMGGAMVRVVGVTRDALQRGVEAAAPAVVYTPITQEGGPSNDSQLIIRAGGDASHIIPAVRDAMRRIDRLEPLPRIQTLEARLADSVAPRRFSFALLSAFAAVGVVLAMIGLYGVLSYLVAERTAEMGIRAALGADARRIMRHVMGEGMLLVGAGVAIGLAGSLGGVRLLQTMLFRVNAYDPLIFTAAVVLLVITALVACAAPAYRAASVNPVDAMRR